MRSHRVPVGGAEVAVGAHAAEEDILTVELRRGAREAIVLRQRRVQRRGLRQHAGELPPRLVRHVGEGRVESGFVLGLEGCELGRREVIAEHDKAECPEVIHLLLAQRPHALLLHVPSGRAGVNTNCRARGDGLDAEGVARERRWRAAGEDGVDRLPLRLRRHGYS